MTEIITLASGLRLAYWNIPYVHSVSVGVFVKIGSKNEAVSNNGIAHFTEHVMFKGTSHRTAFQIVEEMDALGANMNAFTSKEITAYYFQCMDDTVDECAEILSDILLDSMFPADELEKERGVILEEISMVNDTPDDLSQDLCSSSFWKDCSLGRTILGTPENVKSFTPEDIRAFVNEYYVAENMVVSICGNISKERAIALCEKYFPFPSKAYKATPVSLPVTHGGNVCSSIKNIEQANLTLAFPAFSRLDDRVPALSILSSALGGGMSSRLFQEIREKQGLVYSIYSFSSLYEEDGAFGLFFATNPKNTHKALTSVRACIRDLIKNGFTESEFRRAKQQVKGGLVMGQERSLSIMRVMARYALLFNEPFSIDENLEELDALTLEEVNRLLPTIFNTKEIGVGYVGKKPTCDLSRLFK